MADVIDYQIFGDDLQLVEIELDPDEGVRAEAGTMTYMEDGIQMQTGTGGGIFKGLQRAITGESFFITTFLNTGSVKQRAAFAAPYPGKIIPLALEDFGGAIICQKDSFLCAAQGIEIEIAFTKRLGAGIFGGEGFILQRLKGPGMTFVHAGGTVIEKDLAAGESLRVDTGCLVAFSESVDRLRYKIYRRFHERPLRRRRSFPDKPLWAWKSLFTKPALFPTCRPCVGGSTLPADWGEERCCRDRWRYPG
jgi:uncharacterized protein (TIGR00266 family)